MRKICVDENNHITNPNEILKEIQNFYATLYEKNPSILGEDSMNIFSLWDKKIRSYLLSCKKS